MRLAITRFSGPYSVQGSPAVVEAGEFFAGFDRAFVREDKSTVPLWSAATFADDSRAEGSPALSLSMFVGEYDGTLPIATVIETWADFYGKVYSTHSHTIESPRCRFALPYSRPVTPPEHRRICEWMYHRSPELDIKCSRNVKCVWYLPSHKPRAPFESHELTGAILDVEKVLANVPAVPPPEPVKPIDVRHLSSALHRAAACLEKIEPGVDGQHRGTQVFSAAQAMTRGFCLSESDAFSVMWPWARRCDPPCTKAYLERKIKQAAKHGRKESGYLLNRERRVA